MSDPHPIRDFSLLVGYAVRHRMMPNHHEAPENNCVHARTAAVDVAVGVTGTTPETGASCAA
jgi:hypothetical protein